MYLRFLWEVDTRGQVFSVPILILASLMALATTTYFALSTDLYGWELDITRWLQRFSLGPARFLEGWMFWMGVKGVAGAVLLLAVGLLWAKNRRLEAIFLPLISIADFSNIWLREIIGRPRPIVELVDVAQAGSQGSSFPSGTTLHTVLFYGFLLYLATIYISSRRWIYALWAIGVLYMLLSGLWVLYGGRHWFIDAIGGYFYGAFYLFALMAAYNWARVRLQAERAQRLFDSFPGFLRIPMKYVLRLIT